MANYVASCPEGSETSVIETYGNFGIITCRIQHPCDGRTLAKHIQQRLGLREESMQLFGIFLGGLTEQVRLFEPDAQIPIGCRMSFSRFCSLSKLEMKLAIKDDKALHLLFSETKEAISIGTIQPTEEQQTQLDDYLDPMFMVERQYLAVGQLCSGYGQYVFRDCTVNSVPSITVIVAPDRLIVRNEIGDVQYHSIKCWELYDTDRSVSFEVNPTGTRSHYLVVKSQAASFINSAVNKYCHNLAIDLDIIAPPKSTKKVGKTVDPVISFVNSLYKQKPAFDTI